MTGPTGRREASKQATSAALRAAAMRLFAEQGYDATTVADIASAARVTHRTFYRYFDGKEALLSHEFGSWLTTLADAIRARPAAEPPVTAVRHAMLSVSQQASAEPAPVPLWLFGDQRARAACGGPAPGRCCASRPRSPRRSWTGAPPVVPPRRPLIPGMSSRRRSSAGLPARPFAARSSTTAASPDGARARRRGSSGCSIRRSRSSAAKTPGRGHRTSKPSGFRAVGPGLAPGRRSASQG